MAGTAHHAARTDMRSFVEGWRFLPREFGTMRGLFDESKNIFLRVDCASARVRVNDDHGVGHHQN
jgi:hypothetical protein